VDALYIEQVPTAAIRVPSFNGLFLSGWRQMSDAQRARYIEATPLRKGHYRRFGTDGFSKEQVDESIERLRQTVERVDAAVAKGSWLAGDAISIADLCVLPTIVRNVRHWPRRCLGRPSRIQPMVRSHESTAIVRQSILSRFAGRTPVKRSDRERACGTIKVKRRAK
jgi:hypothetical protein